MNESAIKWAEQQLRLAGVKYHQQLVQNHTQIVNVQHPVKRLAFTRCNGAVTKLNGLRCEIGGITYRLRLVRKMPSVRVDIILETV